jgi:HK97 family phage major capsid protein
MTATTTTLEAAFKDALQDCVARKIPLLLREGMAREQAIAVAFSECRDKAIGHGYEVMAWDTMRDDQRAWWLMQFDDVQPAKTALTVIKRLDNGRVGGYGVVYGDWKHRDLEGDYFAADTYFGEQVGTPVTGATKQIAVDWLYDHAMAELPPSAIAFDDARDYKLGRVVSVKADDIGLWIEAETDRHDEWAEAVMQMIDQGKLHWSSGSTPHLVKRAPDGQLTVWPIIEWSSTPTPAEPRHTVVTLKYYVNTQDEPAEGEPKGTPPHSDPAILSDEPMEAEPMAIQLNTHTAAAVIEAYMQAEKATILSAVADADVKQENAIREMLRPMAEQLAELAGVDVDLALGQLVGFVSEHATGDEGTDEGMAEEMPAMEGGEDMPTMLNIESDTLQAMLDEAAQKAVTQGNATREPRGGFRTGDAPNLNFNREEDKPFSLAGYIRAITRKDFGYINRYHRTTAKALGVNPDTAGGFLVPVEQSNQIIELLRSESTVLPLCRTIPMASETLTIPKLTGGATSTWVGENAALTENDATFGQIRLVAQKLGIFMKISNELMADSDPAVDTIIREDMAREAASEIDRVILNGSGVGNEPLGLANIPDVTKTALNAAPTYANLSDAISRVEVENVSANPEWNWVIHPRDKSTLRQLEDTRGGYIFNELGANFAGQGNIPNQLLGYAWNSTTEVPLDTADNNETNIYFGQWNDVIVGMRKTLEIVASQEAGSSFQNDQTWLRAILRMDVNIRHAESIEVLTDVRAS